MIESHLSRISKCLEGGIVLGRETCVFHLSKALQSMAGLAGVSKHHSCQLGYLYSQATG